MKIKEKNYFTLKVKPMANPGQEVTVIQITSRTLCLQVSNNSVDPGVLAPPYSDGLTCLNLRNYHSGMLFLLLEKLDEQPSVRVVSANEPVHSVVPSFHTGIRSYVLAMTIPHCYRHFVICYSSIRIVF